DDLSAAIDILFQNVFLHTPEGTDFGITVVQDGEWVDVTVWDRGPGFDNAPPEADTVGSTRLGLSIASRLAEASGGTMVVDSQPGGGARVHLRLGPPAE
ncbi:MAG TPA: ATP-binding protein, partial [Actinomycetota bacterium]|nr:ATP-binding protein [Actinomycetota bacterium]